MKYFLISICLLFLNQLSAQLNGAVHQKTTPDHLKKERKVEVATPASIAKNNADKLKKSLKLTEKQFNDLHQALIEYEVAVDKTTKSKLSKQEQFKKLNDLNQKRQNKLKTILTEEQFKAYIMSFP